MRPLWLALCHTARLLGSQRKLWIPFFLTALIEIVFLFGLWLAPHPPFSTLLAPPIQYFFGDRVLHYPAHLWFLYHVMKNTHFLASLLLGALMSGAACLMVRQIHQGQPLSFRDALMSGRIHYGRLAFLWLVTWGLAKGLSRGFEALHPAPSLLVLVTCLVILVQALIVYAIPAAVFEQLSWWRALMASLRETCRYPIATCAVVVLPSVSVMMFAIKASPARVAEWMFQAEPEMVFGWIALRLLVWTVADAVLTVGIAHLWWTHRITSPSPVASQQTTAGTVSNPATGQKSSLA